MSGIPFQKSSALLATTALVSGAFAASVLTSPVAHAQDADDAPQEREVITVRGQFIPEERRDTSEISAVVDAEDFAARGDADAAVALARVTGLSISRGRYIFARGLNERYSTATLNGSPLPSPDPLRRVVPLDLFPTSVLASALAQKTYSVQYPLEFGGAVVDLRTVAVPNERFFEIGGSVSYDSETTDQFGLLYDGSGSDWLGFDDGTRNRPAELEAIRGEFDPNSPFLSVEDRTAIARSLNNTAGLWVLQSDDIAPNGSISFSAGERIDAASWLSIGVTAAGGYSNEWETREGTFAVAGLNDDGTVGYTRQVPLDEFSTQNTAAMNGLLSVGLDLFENHEVTGTLLAVRSGEKEARYLEGFFVDGDGFGRQEHLDWTERQLWVSQATGTHYFPSLGDLEVNWRASYSEGFRDAPYQRTAYYEVNNDGVLAFRGRARDNRTQFSYVVDDASDFAVDVTWPFSIGSIEADLIAGYAYTENDRRADQQILQYGSFVSLPPGSLEHRIDAILADQNISPDGGLTLSEVSGTQFPAEYVATLETDAAYIGVDAQVTPNLRLAIGGRFEDSIEVIEVLSNFGDESGVIFPEGGLEEQYFLPAGTVTWTFLDDMQLRLGYSQTIIRPQFRELAPSQFIDTETNDSFFGNPFLVNTELTNYDARFEWYFARDQFFTLGAFYKDLEEPIEEFLLPVGDGNRITTFTNVPSATLYGFEVEYERLFDNLDSLVHWGFLEPLTGVLRFNYTWSDSEIDSTGMRPFVASLSAQDLDPSSPPLNDVEVVVPNGRELLGQSEHIFNLQVGYENYEARSRAMLLYNYASERIRTGGNTSSTQTVAPVIEEPPSSLNFIYSREFDALDSTFEFGFRATNLLDDDYEAYSEGGGVRLPVDTYDIGQTYALSLRVRR